jgi:hypothetical protein
MATGGEIDGIDHDHCRCAPADRIGDHLGAIGARQRPTTVLGVEELLAPAAHVRMSDRVQYDGPVGPVRASVRFGPCASISGCDLVHDTHVVEVCTLWHPGGARIHGSWSATDVEESAATWQAVPIARTDRSIS